MSRSTSSNYSSPSYPIANAATDAFHKEDLQQLALALNGHDHTTGKGLGVNVGSIADNSLSGAKLVDGTVTSAKILDGTIQSVDIAVAGIANDRLGPDVARANLLTNGGFKIWQRGNGAFTANLAYTADQWLLNIGGGSTLSVSRVTTVTSNGGDGDAGAQLGYTFAAAGGQLQTLRISDRPGLKGKTLTLSARVYAQVPNAVRLSLTGDGTGAVTVYSASHSGSSNFETLTVTYSVPNDATYLQCYVPYFIASAATVFVQNAMLVVGSQASNYVPLHPADDLARCLRYYEKILLLNQSWYTDASRGVFFPMIYKALKPVTPTVTKVGTWALTNVSSQPAANVILIDGLNILATTTAAGWTQVSAGAGGDGVTVEANPLLIPVGLLMMQGAQPDYLVYGLTLVALWMMSMNAERTAYLTRQLRQLPGLDCLIDRLRSPASAIRAWSLRMLRPVLP